MKTLFCKTTALASICAMSFAGASWAQDQDPDIINLADLTCRSYLMLGGDERDMTTLYIHGYFSGQADLTSVRISDLAAASEKVLTDCIDQPNQNLLDAFSSVLK